MSLRRRFICLALPSWTASAGHAFELRERAFTAGEHVAGTGSIEKRPSPLGDIRRVLPFAALFVLILSLMIGFDCPC